MDDYRKTQLEELTKKIEETKFLLNDPAMADLASEEIKELESQKTALEEELAESSVESEDLDERNVIIEIKGAAGGDEAKIWGEELIRMYIKFAEANNFKVEQVDENAIGIAGKCSAVKIQR